MLCTRRRAACNAVARKVRWDAVIVVHSTQPAGGVFLAAVSVPDPKFQSALQASHRALRRVAGYVLDPALDRRLRELGERKEFLSPSEHEELMGLVAFSQQRTIDKLEAELALKRIEAACPELASVP
jgi:hypothetical protein